MSVRARFISRVRHLSLRTRTTIVTVGLVAVTLLAGGLVILAALRAELLDNVNEAGVMRAHEIAAQAKDATLPVPLPPMEDPESFAQVVVDGRVVTATSSVDPGAVFDLPAQAPGRLRIHDVESLPVDETGPYRVAALGADTPNGPATIFVAVSTEDVEDTMATATKIAALGGAGLVVVLATLTWLSIGSTLAPIRAIGAQAERISGANLSKRVPEPVQNDEVGRLARIVNRMLDRLETSAERQRSFVADAAHELRSPIASLRAQLETSMAAGRAADDRELLKDALRMQAIVDELLLLARADSDRGWLRPAVIDLDEVIDSAIAATQTSGHVQIDAASQQPVQLYADRDLLEQVFSNLLQNAVRHAATTVRVSGGRVDGVAVIAIEDDGRGVPSDRRADIFERFVRLDAARDRDDGGLGLGLAIVAEIVRAHAGEVSVDDSDLGGARFVVKLPIGRVRG